jgi:PAS domain S-box-containing protein
MVPTIIGLSALSVVLAAIAGWQWRRHRRQLQAVARVVANLAMDPDSPSALPDDRELADVVANLYLLGRTLGQGRFPATSSSSMELLREEVQALAAKTPMTRSGLFESPSSADGRPDPASSGSFSATSDMILRLHPETLSWLDASPPMQEFLGWPLPALRTMAFPDIVHPDHRDLAREQLRASLIKGEAHGLIYRIRTAKGESKAIEMNVSARYGVDLQVTHLRGHVADVTAKLQASRELRRRTRELAQANEQLRAINRELAALEAKLQEKNEHLARANAELSRKNRELDEFTHVVSHDLQEPLRTLIAFSDFLLKDCSERLDDQGREYVRFLVEASRRMRELIADLLDLSRAGSITRDFREVDLNEVVSLVVSDLGELIRARGGEVVIPEPLPCVWGDRTRIGQLLGNLVSNGLKYNQGPAPRVEIGAAASNDPAWATLFVRDNGIGIPPEFHGEIFRLFRRLHTREEFGGTGAGLAICQKIVQAHGGRIWVESDPGKGSTFRFTLPASPTGS